MKSQAIRILIAIVAVLAIGTIIWRLGHTRFIEYRWSSATERGRELAGEGNFVAAATQFEIALQALREIDPSDPRITKALEDLGETYQQLGLYQHAYPIYLTLFQTSVREHGLESIESAYALYDMAQIRQNEGNPEAARGIYSQAIAAWRNIDGGDHPEMAPTLIGMAQVLADLEEHADAKSYYEWALSVQRRTHGSDNPILADLEEAYAKVLRKVGKHDLADRFDSHVAELRKAEEAPPATP